MTAESGGTAMNFNEEISRRGLLEAAAAIGADEMHVSFVGIRRSDDARAERHATGYQTPRRQKRTPTRSN
jgi:hypothetical protein